jgi:hypothetical protein
VSKLKACSICGVEKPNTPEYFGKDGVNKFGEVVTRSCCRPCRKQGSREYYLANTDAVLAKNKSYYRENSASINAKNKVYQAANVEKIQEYQRTYRMENAEELRVYGRKYYEANKQLFKTYRIVNAEKIKVRDKKYREANSSKISARVKIYREANAVVIKAYRKQYYEINKAKYMVFAKARKLLTISRIPKWESNEDKFLMHEIYHLAAMRSKTTGISWEVDYIAPLRGKLVSGLHTPSNLQVIPKEINMQKNNKFTPGDFPVKTNFFGD